MQEGRVGRVRIEQAREAGQGSKPYSTASRQASLTADSFPCCLRLWRELKPASHAGQECALRHRCCHATGSSGGMERERFEDCEDWMRGARALVQMNTEWEETRD